MSAELRTIADDIITSAEQDLLGPLQTNWAHG